MKNTKTPPQGREKQVKQENQVAPNADAAAALDELFVDGLRDIYWAETALVKALPMMAGNATTPSLRAVIKEHIIVTKMHVARLEEAFALLGEKAAGKKCQAMAGLLAEGEEILAETQPGPVRDAGIIAAAQKVEHYEIATYGTLCAMAKVLGQNEVATLLHKTLAEEKEADMLLSDAAFNSINFDATIPDQRT